LPGQLAAVILQIFVGAKLVESYKFEIEYVDGDARMRVSEEETGAAAQSRVEKTSVESMKRTFQVRRSDCGNNVTSARRLAMHRSRFEA